jgi:hypothetical protein
MFDGELISSNSAKILATGSSSCVFKPNIPCKNSKDFIDNKKISKIVYGTKSDKYLDKEKKMNLLIKKIPDYDQWAIIYDKFCKAPSYENILKNYNKDIVKCLDKYYEDKFNDTNNMMVGIYGGETFEDYLVKYAFRDKSKNIDKSMYNLLIKMEPLFHGLTKLYDNNISHLDIKVNNVVIHNNRFKYIDFGLSSELKYNNNFKNRSISELENTRYYLWYPLEYIYLYSPKSEYENEILKISKRKHYDVGVKIYKLLGYDFKKCALDVLSDNSKINNKELYSMIDTFSLGIMIPHLFVDYNQTKFINSSPFLKDIFYLFSRMCEPKYNKRLKPHECYDIYKSIMLKYSTLKSGSKKKSIKKKTKKKSIKKKTKKKSSNTKKSS